MDACNLPELLAQDLDAAEPIFAAKKMTAGAPRRASTIDLDLEEEDKLLPLPSDPRRSAFGGKIHPFPFSSAFSLSSDQPALGLGLSTNGGDDSGDEPAGLSRPVSLTHEELLARLRPTSAVGPHGLRGHHGLNDLDEFNDFSDMDEGGGTTAVLVVPGPGNAPFPPYSNHNIDSDSGSDSDSDSDNESMDSFEIPSIGLYAPHRARREQERLQKEKEQLQQQQRRKQEVLQEQRKWQQQQEELQQQQQRLLLLQQQQQMLQHLLLAHASGSNSIRSMDSSGIRTDGLAAEANQDAHGSQESLSLKDSHEGTSNIVISDRLSISSSASSVEEAIPFDISRRGNSVITTATSVSSVTRSSSQSHTLPALGPSSPHRVDEPSCSKKDQVSFCSWSHDGPVEESDGAVSGRDDDHHSQLDAVSRGLAKSTSHNPLSSWMEFGDDDSDDDGKEEITLGASLETKVRSVTPGPESQSLRSFSPCNSLPTRPSTALGWVGKTAGEPRYSFSSWPEQQKNRLAQSAASSASIHPALRRSGSMSRRAVAPTRMEEPPLLLPKQYQPPLEKKQQQPVCRQPVRSSSVRSHVSESLNALIGAPTARPYRQSITDDDAFLPCQISSASASAITPSKQVKFEQSALRSQFDYDDTDDENNGDESIMQDWSRNSGDFAIHATGDATSSQTAWNQLAQHCNREFAILPMVDGVQHLGDDAMQQSAQRPQVIASIQPLAAAVPSPMVVGIPLPREVIETLRVSVSCFPETMLSLSSYSVQTIRSYSHKIHRCSQPDPGSTHRTIFSLTTSGILPPSPTVASSFHGTAQDWKLSVASPTYASETLAGSSPLPSSSYRRFWKRLVPSRSSPTVVGSHGDGSGLVIPQTPPPTRRTFSGRTSGHDDASFLPDEKDQQLPDGACLKRIFPTGSDYLCDALYAHIVAYNYISLLCPAARETTEAAQPPAHGQLMAAAADTTAPYDNNNNVGDKKRKRQTIRVYVAPDVAVPPTARFLSPEPPRSELLSSPSPPPFFGEEEGEGSREAVLPLSPMETPPPSRGGNSGKRDAYEEDSRYISRKAALFLGISSSLVDENLQSSASARARATAAAEAANSATGYAGSVGSAGGLTRRYNSLRQRRRQRQNGESMEGEDTLSVAVLPTRNKAPLSATPSSLKSAKVRKLVSKQAPSVLPLQPLAAEETVADTAMCDLQEGLASCIHQLVSTLTAAKTLSQLQDQESLAFEFAEMAKDANPMFIRTLCELVRSQEEQF